MPTSPPSSVRRAALAAALLAAAACGDGGAGPDPTPIGVVYPLTAISAPWYSPYPQRLALPAVLGAGLTEQVIVLAGRLELDEPGLRYRARVWRVDVRGSVRDTLTQTDFGRLRPGSYEGGEQAYDLLSEDESDVVGLLVRSDSAGVVRVHGPRRDGWMVYWFER